MRKHTHRRAITPRVPMLVVMHNIPDLSLTERLSVEAFAGGFANTDHFDNLADCRDIMTMAAEDRGDCDALAVCELAYVALSSIKERQVRTGKLGAAGEELKALRLLADSSEDFWKRQGGAVFHRNYLGLKAARKAQKEGQAIA